MYRCVLNADKLKELPSLAAMYTLLAKSAAPPSSGPINIIDLPSTVEKVFKPQMQTHFFYTFKHKTKFCHKITCSCLHQRSIIGATHKHPRHGKAH